MLTKEQFIVDVWEGMGRQAVGADELAAIQDAVATNLGAAATPSPALIARVLADQGARLEHPQILQADARWREHRLFFTPDDLALDTIDAGATFIDKIERCRHEFEKQQPMLERLRVSVQQLKAELETLAASPKVTETRRELAREIAQWLTIWAQNPQIFPEWLALRRNTNEFQQLFGTFPPSSANTNDPRAELADES
jgi:hypothetical protein